MRKLLYVLIILGFIFPKTASGKYHTVSDSLKVYTSATSSSCTYTLTAGAIIQPMATCPGRISFTTNLPNGYPYTLNYKKNGISFSEQIGVNSGAFDMRNLLNGVYSDFVITHLGCEAADNSTKTLSGTNPTVSVSGVVTGSSCNQDGIITFATSLGNTVFGPAYLSYYKDGQFQSSSSIAINNGSFSITYLDEGEYTDFTITNSGCTVKTDTTINLVLPSSTLAITNLAQPTDCGNDGSINLLYTGRWRSYHVIDLLYKKDGVENTKEITLYMPSPEFTPGYPLSQPILLSNLSSGLYSDFRILVSGKPECEVSTTISQPLSSVGPLELTLVETINPYTCGQEAGRLIFSSNRYRNNSAIYSPINYKKDGVATTQYVLISFGKFTLHDLGAGEYTDFAIDGCTPLTTIETTLTIVPQPKFTILETRALCGAPGNGYIKMYTNLSGDYTLNYTFNGVPTQKNVYIISSPYSSASGQILLDNLQDGEYSGFTLTGDCSASLSATVTLLTPTSISLSAGLLKNPTDCNLTGGNINFTVSGIGSNNSSYNLSYTKNGIGQTTNVLVSSGQFTLTGLEEGEYSNFSLQTSIFSGCTGTYGSITLTKTPASSLTAGTSTNPTSCESTSGSISFSTTLPNGTYQLNYKKNNLPLSTSINVSTGMFTLTGLTQGEYTAFAVTENACTTTESTIKTLTCPCSSLLTLASPADDYTTGTHTKKAATSVGKIEATNKITGTSNVSYEAAAIELKPGFTTSGGAVFIAQVGGCN